MALAVQNLATGSGVVGVYGRSDGAAGGGIGVAGACDGGWGVAGVATLPTIDPRGFPNTVGVFGAGDWVGIYGQSRPKEGQLPSALPPPDPSTGIFGIGDVAGVEGDCDGTGAGVVGKSTGGKGVLGNSVSGADIGVYGQSLASLPDSLAILPGTGVFGTGDNVGVSVQAGPDEVVYSPPDHAAIRRWRKRSSFPSRCRPPMSPLARPRTGTLRRGYPSSVPLVTCWH